MSNAGQIVGWTRSGKLIFAFLMDEEFKFPHPGNLDFSLDDHFDTYAVFEVLELRAKRKYGVKSDAHDFWSSHRLYYTGMILANFEELKIRANCKDAFSIADLGRSLCNPEFKDL